MSIYMDSPDGWKNLQDGWELDHLAVTDTIVRIPVVEPFSIERIDSNEWVWSNKFGDVPEIERRVSSAKIISDSRMCI